MIDLPLRDPVPPGEPAADPMPVGDAAAADEPGPRSSGSGMMAVGLLAIGLLAGFGGGFLVGQRMAPPVPPFAEVRRPVQPPSPAMPVGTDAGAVPTAAAPAAVIEEPVAPPGPALEPAPRPALSVAPKPAAPPAPVAGTLQFDSRPNGATIYLDDVRVGVTPMTMNSVRPGTYRIRMELFGHDTWVTTTDVAAGARRRVGASFD